MKLIAAYLFATLRDHPRMTAVFGAASGWFSVDGLAHAKDAAQLFAAVVAGLVSLCALILTGPKAIAEVRGWVRKLFNRQ
jgi:hypothetical protein